MLQSLHLIEVESIIAKKKKSVLRAAVLEPVCRSANWSSNFRSRGGDYRAGYMKSFTIIRPKLHFSTSLRKSEQWLLLNVNRKL